MPFIYRNECRSSNENEIHFSSDLATLCTKLPGQICVIYSPVDSPRHLSGFLQCFQWITTVQIRWLEPCLPYLAKEWRTEQHSTRSRCQPHYQSIYHLYQVRRTKGRSFRMRTDYSIGLNVNLNDQRHAVCWESHVNWIQTRPCHNQE